MQYKLYHEQYISHYGVPGMKWGVRRYQNPDGSLTARGKKRYNEDSSIRLKQHDARIKRGNERTKKSLKVAGAAGLTMIGSTVATAGFGALTLATLSTPVSAIGVLGALGATSVHEVSRLVGLGALGVSAASAAKTVREINRRENTVMNMTEEEHKR